MNERNNRTGSDMAEDLSALVFDLDEFPSSQKAKEILAEEGIDTTALKSWASEKLKGVRARQRLAVARERRLALESKLDSLKQAIGGSMVALRQGILERIQVLGASNPEAAQVFCRKFEEIPDADLADLDAELTLLEAMEDEDVGGNES
jgi:hypothetical protein